MTALQMSQMPAMLTGEGGVSSSSRAAGRNSRSVGSRSRVISPGKGGAAWATAAVAFVTATAVEAATSEAVDATVDAMEAAVDATVDAAPDRIECSRYLRRRLKARASKRRTSAISLPSSTREADAAPSDPSEAAGIETARNANAGQSANMGITLRPVRTACARAWRRRRPACPAVRRGCRPRRPRRP